MDLCVILIIIEFILHTNEVLSTIK